MNSLVHMMWNLMVSPNALRWAKPYSFIEDTLVLGDGECHDLIWKRESDRRYFRFGYQYYDYNYYYQENLEEVFPEQIIKTIYK